MKIKYLLQFVLYLLVGCFIINAVCVILHIPAIISYMCGMIYGAILGHWMFIKTN